MERFDELKSKMKELGGYMKLPQEEQKEYTALKKAKEAAPSNKMEERLAALEKALADKDVENASLREETQKLQDGWKEYKSPAGQNKTATVKIYKENEDDKGGVIVSVRTFKNNAFDEETRKYNKLIYKANVRYSDKETKEIEIEAEELAEIREIEKVEVIKENKRKLRKVQDYVVAPERDKEGYPKRMLSGGSGYGANIGSDKIPLEVFMVKSTVTVRRTNGEEFEMESDYLNI